jgi:hypothetical protein
MTILWISLVPSPMVQSLTVALELLDGVLLDEAVAAVEPDGFVAMRPPYGSRLLVVDLLGRYW